MGQLFEYPAKKPFVWQCTGYVGNDDGDGFMRLDAASEGNCVYRCLNGYFKRRFFLGQPRQKLGRNYRSVQFAKIQIQACFSVIERNVHWIQLNPEYIVMHTTVRFGSFFLRTNSASNGTPPFLMGYPKFFRDLK